MKSLKHSLRPLGRRPNYPVLNDFHLHARLGMRGIDANCGFLTHPIRRFYPESDGEMPGMLPEDLFKRAGVKYSLNRMGPEAELLARCRRGEADAWDELFDLHYSAAERFIFQLAADFTHEDAEEICQETFLSVIRGIDSFHGESRFQTWVFRIAANKARDFRERRNAAKRGGGRTTVSLQAEDPENGLRLDPPGNGLAPDENLITAEQAALLHKALEQLGEPCREIIELRYFGDLSYEELSATLKLNPKTVSSRLCKCLDRLEELARRVFSRENPAPSRLTRS